MMWIRIVLWQHAIPWAHYLIRHQLWFPPLQGGRSWIIKTVLLRSRLLPLQQKPQALVIPLQTAWGYVQRLQPSVWLRISGWEANLERKPRFHSLGFLIWMNQSALMIWIIIEAFCFLYWVSWWKLSDSNWPRLCQNAWKNHLRQLFLHMPIKKQ